jgi:hypothetical protein
LGPCRRRKVDPLLVNLKRRRADHMPVVDLGKLELPDFEVRERPWTPADNASWQEEQAKKANTSVPASTPTPNLEMRDALLQRAANSLIKYVALAGAHGDLDDDIVEMHGLAVKQLIDIAGRDTKLSQQVVDSLERAVVKRTTSKKRAG